MPHPNQDFGTHYFESAESEELLGFLIKARKHLIKCGILLKPSNRLDAYIALATKWRSDPIPDTQEGRVRLMHRLAQAYWEAMQYNEIASTLGVLPKWHSKLASLVSGHELPSHDRNHYWRNIQFELYLASRFKRAGFAVMPEEPDVLCEYRGWHLSIAAKRLRSATKVAERIREASDQIVKSNRPGIIALDISSILWGTSRTLVMDEMETAPIALARVDEYAAELSREVHTQKLADSQWVLFILICCAIRTCDMRRFSLGAAKAAQVIPIFPKQQQMWPKLAAVANAFRRVSY